MSLADIRTMRLARQKPSGVVTVVIGEIPKAHRADQLMVEVLPGSNPALLDWRPLFGVWVSVIHIAGDWNLTDQAVEAVSKAGAKLFGFARAGCFFPLANFDNPEDTRKATWLLRQEWEALCN